MLPSLPIVLWRLSYPKILIDQWIQWRPSHRFVPSLPKRPSFPKLRFVLSLPWLPSRRFVPSHLRNRFDP
jgi:hypothetical protein